MLIISPKQRYYHYIEMIYTLKEQRGDWKMAEIQPLKRIRIDLNLSSD